MNDSVALREGAIATSWAYSGATTNWDARRQVRVRVIAHFRQMMNQRKLKKRRDAP